MSFVLPPMFAGLEPEDQDQARTMLQPCHFEVGEDIMVQGEEDTSVAFVSRGGAEILYDEVRVGMAGVRDIIGEMEMFTGSPRLATIRTTQHTDLLVLGPNEYIELAETGNPLVFRLEQAALRRVGDRIRAMDEQITGLSDGEPFELHPRQEGILSRLNPFKRAGGPRIDAAEVLSRSELFSWAPASALEELGPRFGTAAFSNDQRICVQGEPGETMFIIASGQVDIVLQVGQNRAERIATLGTGMALGDSAILHACPRTATVVAKGDVTALSMDRKTFMELADTIDQTSSVFRQGLIRNLVMQADKTQQRLAFLAKAVEQQQESYQGTPVSMIWRD